VQAFKRDGYARLFSRIKFNSVPGGEVYNPVLAHVILNAIHGKVRFALFT
jgi:hypothetical protein